MYLFKASGATYPAVINRSTHAFRYAPADDATDQLVLFAMNREDTGTSRQVRHLGKVLRVQRAPADLDRTFPGVRASSRWQFVVELYGVTRLACPFDLTQVDGLDAAPYRTAQAFRRLPDVDAMAVTRHLMATNPDAVLQILNAAPPTTT